MTWCSSDPAIARQKRGVQRLGQGDIHRVVCGEVAPKLPGPLEKDIVRVPGQAEVGKVLQGLLPAAPAQPTRSGIPSKNLHDLDVDQVRGVQRLPVSKDTLLDRLSRSCAQEDLDHRGGINDDHLLSRSSRTAASGERGPFTGARDASRRLNSSRVGRSAA